MTGSTKVIGGGRGVVGVGGLEIAHRLIHKDMGTSTTIIVTY